jgi:hypothetical protein
LSSLSTAAAECPTFLTASESRSFDTLEFVGPVLDFMRLQQTDSASVLRTFVREIVGHPVLSDLRFNAVI